MDIAIIGVSLKLPNNINNLDDLYDKLINKTDCISDHRVDRFNPETYYDKNNSIGKFNTKKGGYLSNIYDFDNSFFKISNKEAKTMDPQQRILLELVYEAMKDCNLDLNDISNTNTGVFIGACNIEYFGNNSEEASFCNEYSVTGGLLTLLSNRISYFYNLKGPSMTIDTACSSSGYALHNARKSLISGECNLCIVGGSNLILNPETTVGFSQGAFLSPDGHCKTFDASANGYVRSEGCVVFILKRLSDAIKDKNKIYTIIKESNVNQDGKTNSITMPNQDQQEELLKKCYSNININDITFIEAHGTGTKLGDKIESSSIGNALGSNRNNKLKVGSIKSVIGHTEATAGLAAICKVILMMKYKQFLPNLHFNTPSNDIDFEKLNIEVCSEVEKINTNKIIIGVNNYGFGGANFHCVLQNYDQKIIQYNESSKNNIHLLCIDGNNEEAINKNAFQFLNFKDENFLKYLYNQNEYERHDEAKIYIVKDKNDFEANIFNPNEKLDLSYVYGSFNKNKPNTAFIFCGQGPQYIDMGINFMDNFPIFKNKIFECDKIWLEITNFSFIEKYGIFIKKDIDYDSIPINDPIVAQPAITFFQVALFELYKYFGINPDLVIGHSAGEQASFYASGAISLKETLTISYYRSILQQKTAGSGNMLVINETLDKINTYTENNPKLELAVINSTNSFVLSGPSEDINSLRKELKERNILCTVIRGRCPFHSSYQDIIKDDILKNTKNIKFKSTNCDLISTVTGYYFDETDYTNEYWWDNIRNVVRFNDAIEQSNSIDIFIEISPHTVLEQFISLTHKNSLILQSANRKEDSSRRFLSTLAKLYFSGIKINNKFGEKNNSYYPKYIFNRQKFLQKPQSAINRHNGINNKINSITFSPHKYSYIKDHIIKDNAILPTVTYIDLIQRYILDENNTILNFQINDMYLVDNTDIEFIVNEENSKYTFSNKNKHFVSFSIINEKLDKITININEVLQSKIILDKLQMIKILSNKSFNFKDNLHKFNKAYLLNDTLLIELPNSKLNPTIIDTCLTSNMIIQGLTNNIQYLPSLIEAIEFFNNKNNPKYTYTKLVKNNNHELICNSYLLDENYDIIVKFSKITSKSIDPVNTKIYSLKLNDLKLNNLENNYEHDILSSNMLLIRDTLLQNKNKIYLCNIESNYHIIGFIRSIINELNNVNFKIVYHKNEEHLLINKLNSYNLDNYEYFFDNNVFTQLTLEDYFSKKYDFANYFLFYKNKGNINNLCFKYNNLRALNQNDLLVKIKCSALNFKDISVLYNLIPDNNLGYEFSGEVIQSSSPKFNIGDKVFSTCMNFPANSIGNYVICSDKNTFLNPINCDYDKSASIGISYGTSYLALIKYANITENDTVLIHSATGGLGLAAIELCKLIGCKVIATASTEEKRDYLRSLENVSFVTESRCYEKYKKDILDFTNGGGVDVILASTINEFMETNLSLLKSGGRYLDVGKRQIYENHKIPYKYFIKSIQYHSIHFDKLIVENNDLIKKVMNEVVGLFNEEKLIGMPLQTFDISEYKDAFSMLSKSKHIGKIILNISKDFKPTNCLLPDRIFDETKYYLVTGGMGGLGKKLIEWMKENGAKKFIVTTRSDNTVQDENIITIKTTLLDLDDLKNKLDQYEIDGVFHLAGSINDKFAKDIIQDDINDSFDVKVKGIQNLGTLFESKNHSYFIAFSSIVSLIGNPGQSIYSAANSYMDEYCKIRNNSGLPGLSINLGAIGGCGMIHEDFTLAETMMSNGIDFTVYYSFFEKLKYCILDKELSNVCITDQKWDNLCYLNNNSIFENYLSNENLQNETNIDDVRDKLIKFIGNILDTDNIDNYKNLISYGVDSIMSMEISNFCRDKLNLNIRQIDILQGISIDGILKKNIIKSNVNNNTIKHSDKFIFTTNNETLKIDNFVTETQNNSYCLLFTTIPIIIGITYFFTCY